MSYIYKGTKLVEVSDEDMYHYENYGIYGGILRGEQIAINVSDININTWQENFNCLTNLMLDAIETSKLQNAFIKVNFDNNINFVSIELSVTDYWFNLIMWKLIILSGEQIKSKHIFFDDTLTKKSIKSFVDKFFIKKYKGIIDNVKMNNIIDDSISSYRSINRFSYYLANTINLEDTIDLMKASPEFNQLMHPDLTGVPLQDIKKVGQEITDKAIEIMKNSRSLIGRDHCLADSFRAREAINPRQFREFNFIIGTKPNNEGGIFPEYNKRSFISGGVKDPIDLFMESYAGRMAQILSKTNVGDSGSFARLLGLNNMDTFLHPDPNFVCDSKHFEIVEVKDKVTLNMLKDRWYRLSKTSVEHIINPDTDEWLIGKTIYLRSPMTCNSLAHGDGICYRCYGKQAFINYDINPGKYACELISSKLTQTLLSAKHLLETKVVEMHWSDEFKEFFEIEGNIIRLAPDILLKGYSISINTDMINLVNDSDYYDDDDDDGPSGNLRLNQYNEYVTEFNVVTPTGETISIHTQNFDSMYISEELNDSIRHNTVGGLDDVINIDFAKLQDKPLFFMIIQNNELSKTMNKIIDIINKNSVTKVMNRHQLLQAFIDTAIEGNIGADSVHLEVILANQLRDNDDILEMPFWNYDNDDYQILTLNQALTDNASITISFMYQRLSKALYNPLTFMKRKTSSMDLFFMENPQTYMDNDTIVETKKKDETNNTIIKPIIVKDDSDEENE